MTSPDPQASSPARSGGRRWVYFLPLAVLAGLTGLFLFGLGNDPRLLPSQLINRPLPEFALEAPPGRDRPLTSEVLKGDVSLVNIFGSWCVACLQEHPVLRQIAAEGVVRIHGIDWREKNPADGMAWLRRHGDPYDAVGQDPDSKLAIDLGVTGAPETFVVDAQGVVRYKHVGPITQQDWTEKLKPLIADLRKAAQ
ncbi:DsbE family thiol:disulfide interchange protein [Rhodospirillum rubrum]|uniref:Periplasmic protein thiol-disulfide oxidoreductase DsbE n=1 Tax=Rhodospirillum rubrum (strain ATCC 11170 / ATH 1.1.1 / DSM 467 / LMG 4362 / NCIMB 8255 / S1) TaxID=269796 RepID=Q2RYF6_RHORT|nr:DsbE family thiol:disulfide interchange protein [Rhodospirillum rubrum]ABC20839.1 Periplasmic protein thiol-disulfide oxidoreductase DsbE [Rhodospirillum rubrum ATCC 11170]AEO46506.1 periplasmic protein thiol-disulfide oxidoreductase DsbE [Rhodospirillum rubrum F11]QXG80542.1 DsbE family thiol:disulfide interchange protein [Rhodospirillum rubrum]